jgi:hypothetical protein
LQLLAAAHAAHAAHAVHAAYAARAAHAAHAAHAANDEFTSLRTTISHLLRGRLVGW